MKILALRFGEHFAPPEGTVAAHQKVIEEKGYVGYGKFGAKVSSVFVNEILNSNEPRILLINSGKANRYWAHIVDFQNEKPLEDEYPKYYGNKVESMNSWFKITNFEPAPKDILSKCIVISSRAPLGEVSKHSMSPFFRISYQEQDYVTL